MPDLTPQGILEILASGHLDALRGIIEDDRVEAKSEPYRIDEPRGKLELAKDVSALANCEGGIILIGLRTERSPVHMADEVEEVRTFPETLINREQYHAVLRDWVHPQLEGVDIRWCASAEDPARGIVAITVPNQPEKQRPFLVTRTLDERGRQIDIVFGYVERRRAGVDPMRAHDLHALLRDGRRFADLQQRFDELSAGLHLFQRQLETVEERLLAPAEAGRREPGPPPQPAVPPGVLHERLKDAAVESGLKDRPLYFLAAVPRPAVDLPTLFQENSELVRALNDPPAVRPSGFRIGLGPRARIVRGQLRRAMARDVSVLEFWRDGTLLFVVRLDEYLCWGTLAEGAPLRINPLALCESAYGFADLSRVLFGKARPQPQGTGYTLGLDNLNLRGQTAQLIPGPLGTFRMRLGKDIHTAPGSSREFEVLQEGSEINPGAVAYALVREVYRWFGIDDEGIPYTSDIEGARVIDPEAIRRAGP